MNAKHAQRKVWWCYARAIFLAVVTWSCAAATAQATTVYWKPDSTGTNGPWTSLYQANTQPGWDAASYPNGVDADASGPNVNYATVTNLLNVDVVLGKFWEPLRTVVVVNDDGVHTLTFDVSAGSALLSAHSRQSSIIINPPIILNDPLVINRSAGTAVTDGMIVNGSITGTGNLLLTNGAAASDRGYILLAGPVNMTGDLTLCDQNANASQAYSVISGSIGANVTGLTKWGPGLLTLSGTNNADAGGTRI
jgi:autotransporter-associated beta strand protein